MKTIPLECELAPKHSKKSAKYENYSANGIVLRNNPVRKSNEIVSENNPVRVRISSKTQ